MMKASTILLYFTLAGHGSAHYLMGRLILEGKWTKTWEYVRQVSPDPTVSPAPGYTDMALVAPNIEPKSLDLRCGRNATVAWSKPKTATVKSGDVLGFAAGEPTLYDTDKPLIYHPGPGSVWLSKSPVDDLNEYQGDGDWFKIVSITGRTEQSIELVPGKYDPLKAVWGTYNVDSWNFTIPKSTPPGKYLLRFEHNFINPVDTQFYVNCAHIDIVNTDGEIGTPNPLVKIPGVYVRGQPDLYFDKYSQNFNISTYVAPKPEVWKG